MSTRRPVAPPPIPGFTYISLLGSGGFSDVYLYEQDRPRRKVAVKVLLSDLKTEGARRRFESEANLMAQLSSHPYIVTIFEAEVTEGGHSYLAMEYCSRPSLDVRYRRQRFSVDEVLAVGIQVASAVETAHRAGIAHRDIKPANILVTDYNRPALTDFGISGTLGSDADEDAGMSIPWSPPEQFRDGPVDGIMVDIWALAATLYTLLAGRSPFVMPGADNSQRELISRITAMPVPRLGRADVPESLELALSTAMAKSAASRYSSAHAFALALQRIQAELNLSVTPFEVLEEPHHDGSHPDDGFEETRVRNIASIDPEKTGSAPTFPARTRPQNPRPGATGSGVPAFPAPIRSLHESPAPSAAVPSPSPPHPLSSRQMAEPPLFAGQGAEAVVGNALTGDDWDQATMLRGGTGTGTGTSGRATETQDATIQRAGIMPSALRDPSHEPAVSGSPAAPLHGSPAAPLHGSPAAPPQGRPGPGGNREDQELDATVNRPALAGEVGQDATSDHGKRNLWLSVCGAAVLLLAVVVGIIVATAAPEPKVQPRDPISKAPADALDNGTVPDVSNLAGAVGPSGKVMFSWTNPKPEAGDVYKWRIKTVKDSGNYVNTTLTKVDVVGNPGEPTCIQVIVVRSDGSASPEGGESIACVDTK
ncbi:serine/threonine-protein kinase [Pseudarthrobacter sp. N5]|uniref:serine/threonine-protein kinase n=1 Tax=Pseudarthrobacter sp. N5 TaxID=3418416 RepID=UPI003CF0CA8C